MGLRRVYRAEADCRVQVMGSRLISAPWGLDGGHEGARGYFTLNGSPEGFVDGSTDLKAGDLLEIVTPAPAAMACPPARQVRSGARCS